MTAWLEVKSRCSSQDFGGGILKMPENGRNSCDIRRGGSGLDSKPESLDCHYTLSRDMLNPSCSANGGRVGS